MDPSLYNQIKVSRSELAEFMAGEDTRFYFRVKCDLKDRINYIYKVIFPGFKKFRFYSRFFFSRIAEMIPWSPAKVFIYRRIGVKIGKGVFISPGVVIDVHFPQLIVIEDYVILGWGAMLFTHEFFRDTYTIGRISIGEGAIIGAYAAIRCGSKIKKKENVPLQEIVSYERQNN